MQLGLIIYLTTKHQSKQQFVLAGKFDRPFLPGGKTIVFRVKILLHQAGFDAFTRACNTTSINVTMTERTFHKLKPQIEVFPNTEACMPIFVNERKCDPSSIVFEI